VAVGVAEEKSSRVMEILVNAATPLQLLVGKIVGIGAACLTQMGCLVVVGIGALLLQTPLQARLFGANAGGFSQYLTSISIPFYFLFLVYLAAFSPDATWTKVLSYIPFFTSELMLVRIALGTVTWWEIVATIALMLVAISACAWFSARAYRLGVLMYGQRPGLGQLVKMVWMK
jgi:ABC-2 type transport system permease protein